MGKKKGGGGGGGGDAKAAKKEEKRRKQEAKAQKKAGKQAKKKGLDDDEDDLDALLAEFRAKDADRTAVTIEVTEPPTPRAYFSFTPLEGQHSNELLVFGGEIFDGNMSECYNDLYRLNLDKLEWKKISSPNSPDPRNAHQTVVVRDTAYIFGGEFSKGYQFHHYRDTWKLDLNKNAWTQLELRTGPSPRSGHRMTVWKHFIVLFGGFYETSRGCNYYDDLFFFDMREEKWHLAVPPKTAIKPSARGGFQFNCHNGRNTIYLYGGNRVSVSATTERARNFDDMWALHLALPPKAGMCPEFRWESVPNKGAVPPRKSGATSCVHKNRMVLFGGVVDKETSYDLESEFFNTLHAFDMERRKWYELKVKPKSKAIKDRRRKKDRSGVTIATNDTSYQDSVFDEEDDYANDEDEEEDEDYGNDDDGLDDNAFYVIIDGKITKIEMDDDEEDNEDAKGSSSSKETGEAGAADSEPMAPPPAPSAEDTTNDSPALSNIEGATGATKSGALIENSKQLDTVAEDEVNEESAAQNDEPKLSKEEQRAAKAAKDAAAIAAAVGDESNAPRPRIGAGLAVQGSKLFVYAGGTEVGSRQITFDDLWYVDLNQMDRWHEVYAGKWRDIAWYEDGDDDEEDDEDDDEDDDDESYDNDDDEDDDDDEGNEESNLFGGLTPAQRAKRLNDLRSKLQLGDDSRTPNVKEPLRDFFRRTRDIWVREVLEQTKERLTGKEIRREAFKRADTRFNELLPVLQELDELEEDQKMAEEMQAQEKDRLREKLREKAKKRKAHLAKVAKGEKRAEAKRKGKGKKGSDDEDEDDSDEESD
mmetsp:Transcript_10193/g.19965  ORF Transcript_10193/g.19965 Transcript_10193/m.19965 type:complete len:816 (-) Transcript_10193:161-2608(-)|eukprot:CAMPEP_0171488510 /NCGR_PEP_ID=MMETSP0958-20121227/2242_1 /TAXON_ID=87120 /ORGANISM="Aurantiochytrium limacinum, Strain ATCCMYA-1381" /LENGTH=815 /DNA_ID=CAMNT_0012021621 /DNA_START=160 /DNA_END=2607 /DNA_ORIENTATION=-